GAQTCRISPTTAGTNRALGAEPRSFVKSSHRVRHLVSVDQETRPRFGLYDTLVEGVKMLTDGLLVNELSQVISQATGPAFLLGAVAAFVSALNTRLNRVADRRSALLATRETEASTPGYLEA